MFVSSLECLSGQSLVSFSARKDKNVLEVEDGEREEGRLVSVRFPQELFRQLSEYGAELHYSFPRAVTRAIRGFFVKEGPKELEVLKSGGTLLRLLRSRGDTCSHSFRLPLKFVEQVDRHIAITGESFTDFIIHVCQLWVNGDGADDVKRLNGRKPSRECEEYARIAVKRAIEEVRRLLDRIE